MWSYDSKKSYISPRIAQFKMKPKNHQVAVAVYCNENAKYTFIERRKFGMMLNPELASMSL